MPLPESVYELLSLVKSGTEFRSQIPKQCYNALDIAVAEGFLETDHLLDRYEDGKPSGRPDTMLLLTKTGKGALALHAETGGTPEATGDKPTEPAGTPKVSLDARALGVFIDHPDWTKKRIAKHLDCHEKSLCPKSCPKLAAAIKAHRTPDPSRKVRGSKDPEGNLEAWEDE
jgi:hypothetical protein